MGTQCTDGLVTTLETKSGGDCNCVGIKKVVQNADGSITITFTNGKTFTYIGKGNPGPKGDPGAAGIILLHNDIGDYPTTVDNAYETLSEYTTDHTNDQKTLKSKGDMFRLYARLEAKTDPPVPIASSGRFIINGPGAVNLLIGGMAFGFNNASNNVIEMHADVILKDNTAAAMYIKNFVHARIGNHFMNGFLPEYNYSVPGAFIVSAKTQTLGGAAVDFQTDDYTISVEGYSKAKGDIILTDFRIEKIKLLI